MMQYPPTSAPQAPTPYAPPQGSAPIQAEIEAASVRGRRYQITVGAILAGITVLALALAAIAPDLGLSAGSPVPAGWQQVYHADLTAATTKDYRAWDVNSGCAFYTTGLDANGANGAGDSSGDAICAFAPGSFGADTTQGFYFELTIAPPASVSLYQSSILAVGNVSDSSANGLWFEVSQDGRYVLCDVQCTRGQGIYLTGGTAAWHGNGYVANTIAVRVLPNHTDEVFYINGQQIAEESLDLGVKPALAIGAPGGAETLFTAATLATGQ